MLLQYSWWFLSARFVFCSSYVDLPPKGPLELGCFSVQDIVDLTEPLIVQSWDVDPIIGSNISWNIRGLRPSNCDGSGISHCDPSRAYADIAQLLQKANRSSLLGDMQNYWLSDTGNDGELWNSEWKIHGTCISTLRPPCYARYTMGEEAVGFFARAMALFKSLPTYDVSCLSVFRAVLI